MKWDHSPLKQSEKKMHTEEWNMAFPMLYSPKTMEMWQVLGPFLIGICFRQGRNKDRFNPVLGLSNLAENTDYLGFDCSKEFHTITRYTKVEYRSKIIQSVKDFQPIPLGTNVSYKICENVILNRFGGVWGTSPFLSYHQLGLMTSLCCYCGKNREETCHATKELYSKYEGNFPGKGEERETNVKLAMQLYKPIEEFQVGIEKTIEHLGLSNCPRYKILY